MWYLFSSFREPSHPVPLFDFFFSFPSLGGPAFFFYFNRVDALPTPLTPLVLTFLCAPSMTPLPFLSVTLNLRVSFFRLSSPAVLSSGVPPRGPTPYRPFTLGRIYFRLHLFRVTNPFPKSFFSVLCRLIFVRCLVKLGDGPGCFPLFGSPFVSSMTFSFFPFTLPFSRTFSLSFGGTQTGHRHPFPPVWKPHRVTRTPIGGAPLFSWATGRVSFLPSGGINVLSPLLRPCPHRASFSWPMRLPIFGWIGHRLFQIPK